MYSERLANSQAFTILHPTEPQPLFEQQFFRTFALWKNGKARHRCGASTPLHCPIRTSPSSPLFFRTQSPCRTVADA
ncbi:MAG: hypothetical protein IJV22_04305 [Bacteroidales bacterium]|nr:hypothetical protein [Bacteroidales bacterium]